MASKKSAASAWAAFPFDAKGFTHAGDALKKAWPKLHAGDCEPFPDAKRAAALLKAAGKAAPKLDADALATALQEAWRAFHRGDFKAAFEAGEALGPVGASVAAKAIGIHATYGMDVQASPYVDKARGVRLGDIVTMKTFKNKISPKDRMLNLYLEWNQGFDLVKTDFEFLLTHQASPFAVASETEKRRLYRHDGGVVCKELSSKKFGSEEEFLRAFYSNTDFCMSMREKLRIRGCGFQFENMFAALPDGELPEAKPGAADGLSGVLGVPAGSDIDPESPEAIDGALSENEAAAAEADEESGDAGGFANG